MAMPRAWPSFSVALASLLTKVASTAASSGRNSSTTLHEPVVDGRPAARRATPCRWSRPSRRRRKSSRLPSTSIDAPAGAAEPRIDAEDANRAAHLCSVDSPRRPSLRGKAFAATWRLAPYLPNRARPRAARARQPEPHRDRSPNSATFAAALADRRIYAAMAVAALAGVDARLLRLRRRMIYMPLIAAIYDPRIAAVTILLVDFVSARRRSPSPRSAAAPGARCCRCRSPWRSRLPIGTLAAARARPDRAALVHRRRGAEPGAGPGVGLALSRPAAPADHRRRRPVLRRRRRRGADRRPAGASSTGSAAANQRQDGARQSDGVLS